MPGWVMWCFPPTGMVRPILPEEYECASLGGISKLRKTSETSPGYPRDSPSVGFPPTRPGSTTTPGYFMKSFVLSMSTFYWLFPSWGGNLGDVSPG